MEPLDLDLLDAAYQSQPEAPKPRHKAEGVHVRPGLPPVAWDGLPAWGSSPEARAARQLEDRGLGELRARVFTINDAGRAERARLHAAGVIRDAVVVVDLMRLPCSR